MFFNVAVADIRPIPLVHYDCTFTVEVWFPSIYHWMVFFYLIFYLLSNFKTRAAIRWRVHQHDNFSIETLWFMPVINRTCVYEDEATGIELYTILIGVHMCIVDTYRYLYLPCPQTGSLLQLHYILYMWNHVYSSRVTIPPHVYMQPDCLPPDAGCCCNYHLATCVWYLVRGNIIRIDNYCHPFRHSAIQKCSFSYNVLCVPGEIVCRGWWRWYNVVQSVEIVELYL